MSAPSFRRSMPSISPDKSAMKKMTRKGISIQNGSLRQSSKNQGKDGNIGGMKMLTTKYGWKKERASFQD
jgi:hypothetical protein